MQVALSPEALIQDTPHGRRTLTTQRYELVQFCHGAPGFVVSLWTVRNKGLFPELRSIDDVIGREGRQFREGVY